MAGWNWGSSDTMLKICSSSRASVFSTSMRDIDGMHVGLCLKTSTCRGAARGAGLALRRRRKKISEAKWERFWRRPHRWRYSHAMQRRRFSSELQGDIEMATFYSEVTTWYRPNGRQPSRREKLWFLPTISRSSGGGASGGGGGPLRLLAPDARGNKQKEK